MKQVFITKGTISLKDVPIPAVRDGSVLIKVVNSSISAGTEMAAVKSSGGSLIKTALKQPSRVFKLLNMIRSEGLIQTYKKIMGTQSFGSPTGYSISGIVIGIGKGVNEFSVGDRVCAAGAGYANHAEFVDVPKNLVVKLPEEVGFKEGSTVAIGSIALHGVRRAALQIGEFCAVLGTGIIGLLTVQILKSAGIRVAAIDINERRLKIAKELGAELAINSSNEDLFNIIDGWTGSKGVDAVIFTASTTSSEPLSAAFKICRKKGKVVMVGVSGMDIKRADMYKKELELLMSTSYGPGRYDPDYEEGGMIYPYAYVRWTETRNMEEYLRLIATGAVKLDRIIERIYKIEDAAEAFAALKSPDRPLLVLLDYGENLPEEFSGIKTETKKIIGKVGATKKGIINIGLVGVGNFTTSVHIPNILKLKDKFRIRGVMSITGVSAKKVGEQIGAVYATSDLNEILNDAEIDLVFISTRHDSHGKLVLEALKAGKHVFVEKPLTIYNEELDEIRKFYEKPDNNKPLLAIGFNRRFSPHISAIKKIVDKRINPLFIHYRVNAGYLPFDHWVHKQGGRIIGEGCHFIDLMRYIIGHPPKTIFYESLTPSTEKYSSEDNRVIVLKYKDGSVATIEYFAVGNKNYPKEFMEIHFDGNTITMDNYKRTEFYGLKKGPIITEKISKGHYEELLEIYRALTDPNFGYPIPPEEIFETTEITLKMLENKPIIKE